MLKFRMQPAQCRAARALIGMSQEDLAAGSAVAKATIAAFELGQRQPYQRTIEALHRALSDAGVVFIDENGEGPGVRLRKGL